ncbi:MAG: glycosyltransferase family 39 protein [Gemmatimonadota bacterium]
MPIASSPSVESLTSRPSRSLIAALVLLRFLLPLVTRHPAWGIHRDEYLYFAMGDHLDLFRMQFPPMLAIVAAAGRAIFGESVLAARVPAAAAGALLTAVVLLLVRRLGGGWRALCVTWLALLAAPVFVRSSLLMQPVIFDQLWATLALAALTLAAHERAPRWWLLVGVALGLGALTKFSVAFVGISVAAVMLLDGELRGHLRTRWPWLAVLVATLLAVPSITGQVLHDWPFLAQMRTLRSGQLEQVSAAGFLLEQPMLLAAAVLCVVPALLAAIRGTARERVPSLAAAAMLLVMLVLHGKAYYAAPVYPVLIGIGALTLERVARNTRWLVPVVATLLVAGTLVTWPLGIPVLSPQRTIAYLRTLGLTEETNRGVRVPLPQDYADMLGWRELADSVGDVVSRLPSAQREELTVIGGNYGQAGALAFHGPSRGVPYPRSTAGDFFAWGPGPASANTALVIASDDDAEATLRQLYDTVRVERVIRNPLGVPEEQRVTLYLARGARQSLRTLWPSLGPNWQ